MLSKPNIYLSITATDLGESRALARDVLLHIQCTPVEPPRDLPASAADARKLLRKQISACDTVVCIVGKHYGPEPAERGENEPRRSYRQLEYDIAQELRKRIIIFICDDKYDYDDAPTATTEPAEPADLAALQQAHRTQLLSGKKIFTPVANSAALEKRLYELQERMTQLAREVERARRRTRWIIAASVLTALLLGAALYLLVARMQTTDTTVGAIGEKISKLNAEMEQIRTRIDAVAKAYVQDQAEADRLNIPPDEQYKNAIAKVAGQENIPPALLSAQIQVFVKNTNTAAAAGNAAATSELDRARADFAARNFSAAAKGATRAALALRVQRLAAAEAAATDATQAAQLRQKAGEVKTFVEGLQATGTDAPPAVPMQ